MKLSNILPSFGLLEMVLDLFETKDAAIQQVSQGKKSIGRLFAALEKDVTARSDLGLNDMDFRQATPEQRQQAVQSLVQKIAEFDPTPNGKYVRWLTNIYLSLINRGTGKALEDLPAVQEPLQAFVQNFNQLSPQERNIENYKTIDQLKQAMADYSVEEEPDAEILGHGDDYIQDPQTGQRRRMTLGEIRKKAYAESKKLNFSGIDVYIPTTRVAAKYLGRGTDWCTAYTKAENRFEEYNKNGTLYIIMVRGAGSADDESRTGNVQKYQFYIPNEGFSNNAEFKDKNDKEIGGTQHATMLSKIDGYRKFVDSLLGEVLNRIA